MDGTTIILFSAITLSVLTFISQLMLCFKSKSTLVKFIPMSVLLLLASSSAICGGTTDGWDAVGWVMLTFLIMFWLLICGAGWLIWLIVQFVQIKNT